MNGHARADGMDAYGSVILGDSREKKLDSSRQHEDDRTPITAGFVGNPNCGEATLFNAFTDVEPEVASWPSVTVGRVEGEISYRGRPIKVIDLPGIYSLTPYTIKERVTRKCIENGGVDVIINVMDVSSLERNLYLTMQLIELKELVILALNMIDIVKERGMEIDMYRLPEMLGEIPVVSVSARKRTGLGALMYAMAHYCEEGPQGVVIRYSQEVEKGIRLIKEALFEKYGEMDSMRQHVIKFLEFDQVVIDGHPLDDASRILPRDYEKQIINGRYDHIEEVIEECPSNKDEKVTTTDRMDRLMTHPVWGIPAFLGIMALVLFLTLTVGDFLKEYFQMELGMSSSAALSLLTSVHAAQWTTPPIVDGIIAGVDGILIFLPSISILSLAPVLLEDSGYTARVAYAMSETMGTVGLSGKTFLPVLLGFGYTAPAVVATRTLESVKDRRGTILVTPFMSCSARLSIYVLFVEMFFPDRVPIVACSLYVIGLCMAILVAFIVHIHGKNDSAQNALLVGLPEYRTPNGRTVTIYVWDEVRDYSSKAGATIFIASVVFWPVLNLGPKGFVSDVPNSFAAVIGHVLVPVLRPVSLGQQRMAVALTSGLSAGEVVASSFSVLYGVNNVDPAAGVTALSSQFTMTGSGRVDAYVLMILCLLCSPCIAAVATIKRETGSQKWIIGMILFQLAATWAGAMLVFQLSSLISQQYLDNERIGISRGSL